MLHRLAHGVLTTQEGKTEAFDHSIIIHSTVKAAIVLSQEEI
jgi:predicted NAD/FAD-binding protein